MPSNIKDKAKNLVEKVAPNLSIPIAAHKSSSTRAAADQAPPTAPGPKTPADEGISFFSGENQGDDISKVIRVFELGLGPEGGPIGKRGYVRLPPPHPTPYVLRISLEPGTPACRNGVLKSDFPLDGGKFQRGRWSERKLPVDFSKPVFIDLPISHAGSFAYFIEYDETPSHASSAPIKEKKRIQGEIMYFSVDPILMIPTRPEILDKATMQPILVPAVEEAKDRAEKEGKTLLPMDGLTMLSVIAKWQGKLSEWDPYLFEASQRGYNMLHFTPLQARGESGSPYSILDQLRFDPELFEGEGDGVKEIGKMIKRCREVFGLCSLTDVVLNHTANNSPWLEDHPESGYSPANSPHLTPALELDTALIKLSGELKSKGLPTILKTQADLDGVAIAIDETIASLNLWQYYVIDTKNHVQELEVALKENKPSSSNLFNEVDLTGKTPEGLAIALRSTAGAIDGLGSFASRFCTQVSLNNALSFYAKAGLKTVAEWGKILDIVNVPLYEEFNDDSKAQRDNVKDRLRYTRLDPNGEQLGEITEKNPLIETYFTRLPVNKTTAKFDHSSLSLANNGWIWNANPLANFAESNSKSYLRREVIVWGDCVKLRYGKQPSDNPWLWKHMAEYCSLLAGMFDGFRLDNCHSTPMEVGVYMIDASRVVNPNLYVVAELFTGSEDMDLLFVQKLGINSLIREMMNAGDPKEQSRLFGVATPIGSMGAACLTTKGELESPTGKGPVRPCIISPLEGTSPHAVLTDCTHDNQSPLDKRSAEDALSTGALAAFSGCAAGSNKGFDDLYPKLLNIVSEKRKYEVGGADGGVHRGIGSVKRVLNHIHTEMALQGFTEGHVHQEGDYIAMHRIHPETHEGYFLVAHTAFNKGDLKSRGDANPIKLYGHETTFIIGGSVEVSSYESSKSETTLEGLPAVFKHINTTEQRKGVDESGPFTEVMIPAVFPPGSIMLFSTTMPSLSPDLDTFCADGAEVAFKELDLVDLNVILFRSDGEERDATGGDGVYEIPNYGKLVYCGLQGWMAPLKPIIQYNDLGAPLCGHLREGTWALDYVQNRLDKQLAARPRLQVPFVWLKERFDVIKQTVPSFLRPKYFAIVLNEAYKAARNTVIEHCSDFVTSGHFFTHDLALTSVQMYGFVQSASLIPQKPVPSLAAGLPHFSTSWARCWGRDVFISLRGLLLTTGQFEAAKSHVLGFGSVLKHGLVPNLLDSGKTPRYNCRDGPWWFIENIQDYVKMAPNGLSILSESVKRRFPADDTWVPFDDPRAFAYSSTVAELIQEILQRHAEGIIFREYNAGPNLDMQMTDEGFNQKIYTDWKTGFIYGGNRFNCGTWQDKMGESAKAGNKGLPATPRDGAPVEITALHKSALRWLAELSQEGKFPFKGVNATIDGKKNFVTYQEWSDLIQASFEKHYYIPLDAAEDSNYVLNSKLVNRRGIYKDVVGSGEGREWSDYQLRANFPAAMIVAPELFTPEYALGALRIADKVLRGPLGMKTLDPSDSQYRPNYDNSNDSTDQSVAKGWNYHQGPEWLFPTGWFLKAYLHFDSTVGLGKDDITETLYYISNCLLEARRHISSDAWAGLPELTNADGAFCYDSCRTQAWSSSTLLDLMLAISELDINKH